MPHHHPPFDAELVPVLSELRVEDSALERGPEWLAQARAQENALAPSVEQLSRGGQVAVDERRVTGLADGIDLDVLILRAEDPTPHAPCFFHTHGGGMITGNLRTETEQLAEWVETFGAVAVSVDYRLAPEHPHPVPIEDCYAGLLWVADRAHELGFDPQQLIVSGMSAGGGLAAALALMARDRRGPTLAGQMLMCPMIDDRCSTPSSFEPLEDGGWDRPSNLFAWTALLGETRGTPDVSPYAAPARALSLEGLPPAFLDIGSVDVFRDEVLDYAARLWRAGGDAELHVWPGGFHAFDFYAPAARLSQLAKGARVTWIDHLLRRSASA